MGVTCRSDADYDKTLGLITKRLQQDSERVTREALPTCWADLILYLDEQERKTVAGSQPKPGAHAGLAETERVVVNQENVLRELMRTEEPTEEAAALLEDLRRRVARAVAERH